MSVNKVILIGRLGQDPELKQTNTGSVCKFSLATSENWINKEGQKQEKVEWHKIVVWGKLADVCNKFLSKGKQVFVEGKIQSNQWEDKEGVKRTTVEVLANTVQFLSSTENSSISSDAPKESNSFFKSTNDDFLTEEIPF
jgi:single-strand DNA-binding protein